MDWKGLCLVLIASWGCVGLPGSSQESDSIDDSHYQNDIAGRREEDGRIQQLMDQNYFLLNRLDQLDEKVNRLNQMDEKVKQLERNVNCFTRKQDCPPKRKRLRANLKFKRPNPVCVKPPCPGFRFPAVNL